MMPSPPAVSAQPTPARPPTLPPAQTHDSDNGDSARSRSGYRIGTETLLLAASAYFALSANGGFIDAALRAGGGALPGWAYGALLGVGLVALHFLLLAPVSTRHTVKPLLTLLLVASALASHFMRAHGVYLDPTMMRNVLHTVPAEGRELLTWSLLPHLAIYAGLPLLLLSRLKLRQRPWPRALALRLGAIALAALALVAAVMAAYQPLASLMRNHKEVRYLITPANIVWSVAETLRADARAKVLARTPIGEDARPGPSWALAPRPRLVVLVVGETARAANWGLNGYQRQTTPELARISDLVSFAEVHSCGTNTEVSLPCMFAPVGRRDYDERRIRESESLLHVVARAGVEVHWRDNQTGCKGVCDGLPHDEVAALDPAGLCAEGRCLDEGLLDGLDARLARAEAGRGSQLLVLHMLGNHGPSYYRRYPSAFARFTPACGHDDLQRCTRQEIVNAYDNALLYTDHLLASLVARLRAHAGRLDSALVFVSDHGESLGENGLYLHGVPYAIAPEVQTRVPMLMWLSEGYARGRGVDGACLRRRAAQPASHDHLFHTLLDLLDVRTALYEPAWDLLAGCHAEP